MLEDCQPESAGFIIFPKMKMDMIVMREVYLLLNTQLVTQ